MSKSIYHFSAEGGLESVCPQKLSNGVLHIEAFNDVLTCMLFTKDPCISDLSYFITTESNTNIPIIYERFTDALKGHCSGITGCIYELNGDDFKHTKEYRNNGFVVELLTSEVSASVIREIQIDDAYKYIQKLEKDGKLLIRHFPQRTDEIPYDDEDIVIKAVVYSRESESQKNDIMPFIARHFPKLLDRVKDGFTHNLFADIDNLNALIPLSKKHKLRLIFEKTADILVGLIIIGFSVHQFLAKNLFNGLMMVGFGLSLIVGSNTVKSFCKHNFTKYKLDLCDILSVLFFFIGIGLYLYQW